MSQEPFPRRILEPFRMLSPAYRRWRGLLASCDLDPDDLARPVEGLSEGDFIICGCPRTGTALATAMLFHPPSVITVMEPWDGLRMQPARLFESLREELAQGIIRRGRLDVARLREAGVVEWCRDGEKPQPVTVDPDFRLGVKWPSFWRYMELLPETRFVVCLRHPLEVVESFRRLGGRLAAGFDYDVAFNRRMNGELARRTDDPAVRRILLYDYINSRILPHLHQRNVFVLRYERWFTDPDHLRAELETFLDVRLPQGPALRQPTVAHVSRESLVLLRRHCSTARALGYDLEEPVA